MSVAGYQLKLKQALSLDLKELQSARRIRDWYEHWNGREPGLSGSEPHPAINGINWR